MTRPFAGIRILDLTHVLAGPFCSWQFALLGADVIKVEDPSAPDCARGRGPDPEENAALLGLNYQVQGTNKRAIAIDLKTKVGRGLLLRLAETADVLVENYRTGALDALGLGYPQLRNVNPAIVYCSITGYGDTGPRAATGAYDNTIQAASGVIDQSGGHKPGVSFVDYSAGYNAAFAVSAALFRRQRDGVGTHVTCSMYETALMLMAPELAAATRPDSASRGKEAGISSYPTADGVFMLGAFTPEQNRRLWLLLSELGYDAQDFAETNDWPSLWQKSARMRDALDAIMRTRSAEAWQSLFHEAGLPGERVRSLKEAAADPQLQARGFFAPAPANAESHSGQSLPLAAYRLSEDGPSIETAAPSPGQHTDEILAALGLDGEEIDRLRARSIIR